MSEVMFKFAIGDLVLTRVGIAEAESQCRHGEACFPNLHVVIERVIQECPGGMQLKYQIARNGIQHLVLEIELAPPEDFDEARNMALARAAKGGASS